MQVNYKNKELTLPVNLVEQIFKNYYNALMELTLEKRNIKLPNGSTLEIEASERFYEAIRFEYNLDENTIVTDDQIRLFVHGTMSNAVDTAEKEVIISG